VSPPAEQLDELVQRYGTPLYVYRVDEARRAAVALLDSLPQGVRVFYSLKANPHPALVAAMAGLGLRPEISSAGELAAVAEAGVPGDGCLYTGPAKTVTEMAGAIRYGARLFSVESAADRERLVTAAGTVPVRYLVRLNASVRSGGAGLRMSGGPSQFGVGVDTLHPGAPLLSAAGAVAPVGYHLFSASNLTNEAALLAELRANVAAAARLADRVRFPPRVVDIGGGFGAPFAAPGHRPVYPDMRTSLTDALDAAFPGWRSGTPTVAVETGRHVVAGAGTLLTTVMDVKVSGGRTYLVCDAGVNVLGGMSGLGRLLTPTAQPAGQPASARQAVLVGPLCTPLDILSGRASVGHDPSIGQVLAVPNVGAYGLTASLVAFLGRPLPVEVVLDGGTVVHARRLALTATTLPTTSTVDGRDTSMTRLR
jgi:diaminopimelate decarboxylase